MIHNRLVALFYRVGCFLFALFGLLSVMNIFSGRFNLAITAYYTIQSNFLAVILFAVLIFGTAKGLKQDGMIGRTGYYARFEMVCVIDLLLTLVVYWLMLAPSFFSMGGSFFLASFGNLAAHLITPLLCLMDYILFTDSGHLLYRDVYFVLIYPLAYVVLTSAAGLLGYVYSVNNDGTPARFPYFFYNFDQIGALAMLYIGALVLFFLLLSHGFYWFDKKVKKPVLLPMRNKD